MNRWPRLIRSASLIDVERWADKPGRAAIRSSASVRSVGVNSPPIPGARCEIADARIFCIDRELDAVAREFHCHSAGCDAGFHAETLRSASSRDLAGVLPGFFEPVPMALHANRVVPKADAVYALAGR
jgi:hypothetical protein